MKKLSFFKKKLILDFKTMSEKEEMQEIFNNLLCYDTLSIIISYLPRCSHCKSIENIHKYWYRETPYQVMVCDNCASYLSKKHGEWWTHYIDKPELTEYDFFDFLSDSDCPS